MALPTTFDALFRSFAPGVPVNFMRSLAWHESRMNPSESNDPAWGLMQITPVVVQGTGYSMQDMLDPKKNVQIAGGLLSRIVDTYKRHPSKNLKEDWSNPEFVKLVLAGWNSGYSEGGGVGKVASYLEQRGIPVTHDSVFANASAARATSHLQNTAKQRWQRQVAADYFVEGGPGLLQSRTFLYAAVTVGALAGAFLLWRKYRA